MLVRLCSVVGQQPVATTNTQSQILNMLVKFEPSRIAVVQRFWDIVIGASCSIPSSPGSCRTWKTCLVSGRTPSITTCGGTCRPLFWSHSSPPLLSRCPSAPRGTTPGWSQRSAHFSHLHMFEGGIKLSVTRLFPVNPSRGQSVFRATLPGL